MKFIAAISEDEELKTLWAGDEEEWKHVQQQVEFLKRQAINLAKEHAKKGQAVWRATEKRLVELGKLPADFNQKLAPGLKVKDGVIFQREKCKDCGEEHEAGDLLGGMDGMPEGLKSMIMEAIVHAQPQGKGGPLGTKRDH